ncbi:MAG: ABC transporter substrate-binding protein [Eubacterium sp.]|nr:ABC transporter substrate-binding protein [Eubacterium sp.]
MRKNSKLITALLACTAAAALFAGCGNKNAGNTAASTAAASTAAASKTEEKAEASAKSAGSGEVFKIGAIGPLTGGAAQYGTAVVNAAELAVAEINEAGGINGYLVEYRGEDDEHDAEKAVNAYNTLKDWGMQILDGTTTSAPCIAVAEKTANDNMFQITPSGSAVDCVKNPNVFRVCFSDPDQGIASADYMAENELGTKIGIIYDSSDVYSSGIEAKFVEEAKAKGLDVFDPQAFTADSKTDFSAQLQNISAAGCDVVFLPIYYTESSIILTQADKMGYDPIFFSCDGLDGILSMENFDTTLAEGVMLLTPFAADAEDELTKNFVESYVAAYGEIPNQFAADSYDAIYAIKEAAEAQGVTPDMSVSDICEALKKGITSLKFAGLTSDEITWSESGEPSKAPKAVIIEDGSYVSIQ